MKQVWGWVAVLSVFGCSGQVDLGAAEASNISRLGADLVEFAAVPSGMCALFDDERAYCWGREGSMDARRAPQLDAARLAGPGSQGEICGIDGEGGVSCSTAIGEKRATKLGLSPAKGVSVGFFGGCALAENGDVQCWSADSPCPGTTSDQWLHMVLPRPATQVSFGESHGCAVTEDGALFCFGQNFNGQSGQPSAIDCVGVPQPVPGLDHVLQVATGMEHTCALHENGKVSCFGSEQNLGGAEMNVGNPAVVDVPGLDGVVAIKSSRIATCALESSGTLKCWGLSQCGSLGVSEDCESTLVPQPIAVQGQLDIQDFGMADGMTCALTRQGDVQCWGFTLWNGSAHGDPTPRFVAFN